MAPWASRQTARRWTRRSGLRAGVVCRGAGARDAGAAPSSRLLELLTLRSLRVDSSSISSSSAELERLTRLRYLRDGRSPAAASWRQASLSSGTTIASRRRGRPGARRRRSQKRRRARARAGSPDASPRIVPDPTPRTPRAAARARDRGRSIPRGRGGAATRRRGSGRNSLLARVAVASERPTRYPRKNLPGGSRRRRGHDVDIPWRRRPPRREVRRGRATKPRALRRGRRPIDKPCSQLHSAEPQRALCGCGRGAAVRLRRLRVALMMFEAPEAFVKGRRPTSSCWPAAPWIQGRAARNQWSVET